MLSYIYLKCKWSIPNYLTVVSFCLMSMFSRPLHSINLPLLIWMCVMCVCCVCEYRQCPEHIIAASCLVNDCAGNSNMHSSSFGIPLPQGGPQTSARRCGEKTHEKKTQVSDSDESIISISTHVTSSRQLTQELNWPQPIINCMHTQSDAVCAHSRLTVTGLSHCKHPANIDLVRAP